MTGGADDAALIAAAAAGDSAAFAELVERHAGMVVAVCRSHLGDDEADDAAQEAFVKAWRAAPSFAGRASVRTWLYRIAVNAARDRLRTRRRRPAAVDVDIGELAERVADPHDIDAQLAGRDVDPALRRALAQLSTPQREAVVLADVYGVPHAELARRHGVAVGTIKSRLHRAHARLADLLAQAEPETPSDASKPSP